MREEVKLRIYVPLKLILTYETQPFRLLLDDVGGDGWMVGDLLYQ